MCWVGLNTSGTAVLWMQCVIGLSSFVTVVAYSAVLVLGHAGLAELILNNMFECWLVQLSEWMYLDWFVTGSLQTFIESTYIFNQMVTQGDQNTDNEYNIYCPSLVSRIGTWWYLVMGKHLVTLGWVKVTCMLLGVRQLHASSIEWEIYLIVILI